MCRYAPSSWCICWILSLDKHVCKWKCQRIELTARFYPETITITPAAAPTMRKKTPPKHVMCVDFSQFWSVRSAIFACMYMFGCAHNIFMWIGSILSCACDIQHISTCQYSRYATPYTHIYIYIGLRLFSESKPIDVFQIYLSCQNVMGFLSLRVCMCSFVCIHFDYKLLHWKMKTSQKRQHKQHTSKTTINE